MKKIMLSLFIICLIGIASCKNDLISMDEDLLDKTKDSVDPVLVIDSPETESLFDQTVRVTGYVTDDGAVLPELNYSVKNELGETKAEGIVELTQEIVDNGVKGTFSFHFSTSNMDSDVLLEMVAVDWNKNETVAESLKLLYPGSSIPTFSAEAGNNQITLTWDPVDGADSYTVYYSPKGEPYFENSANTVTLTAEEVGDSASVILTKSEHDVDNGWMTKVRVKAESETDSWLSPLLDVIPVSSFSLFPKSNSFTDKIELSWKPIHLPDGEELNYAVYRSTVADGVYTQISSDSLNQASYVDKNITSGSLWFYKIGYHSEDGTKSDTLSEALPCSDD